MTTIHLVYPHGTRISTPDAIGRELGRRLECSYRVVYHDWDAGVRIRPAPGDVLIGHPHPAPGTCFRRSMREPGWRRILILSPYAHGDLVQCAFLDPLLAGCHQYLAITGAYWFRRVQDSPFSHWQPKMVHLDLAVERRDFPAVKHAFNPPGQRRFVYIGHTGFYKNTAYLSQIAQALPECEFGWIGGGRGEIAGLRRLGFQNFSSAAGRQLLAQHDFLLTVGYADANPTTILEAMAWGLLPVCTPQSGYESGQPHTAGIANVPLDDVAGAVSVLRALQELSEDELRRRQQANWTALDAHFHWERFAGQVLAAIASTDQPALGACPAERRRQLRRIALRSPYAAWRPLNLARQLKRRLAELRPWH